MNRVIRNLCCLCFCLVTPLALFGQFRPNEYQVKAAFLYNFGKFVGWPAGSSGQGESFSVCIIGQDPFGKVLDSTVSGETVGGRAVVPKRISRLQDITGCRILFISGSEESRLGNILGAVDKAAILTVSDIAGFADRGGMIQFVVKDNSVRFQIDLRSAENAGLTVSSELLKLAVDVRRSPKGT